MDKKTIDIKFFKGARGDEQLVLLGASEDKGLSSAALKFDKQHGGFIAAVLRKSPAFKAKAGESLCLALPDSYPYAQALLMGLGRDKTLDVHKAEEAGGKIWPALARSKAQKIVFLCDLNETLAGHFVAGLHLRSYRFDQYKTPKEDDQGPRNIGVNVVTDHHSAAQTVYESLRPEIEGVFFARDLVNEPPNMILPDMFALRLRTELKPLGVDVEILDEKKMARLGMGALLAVGQGSAHPPRLVVMRWNGGKGKKAPVALVGKGVTFDTGGISIKPAQGMEEMKLDMGGAAAVAGTMKALALLEARVNVVGLVGLVENMPSGNAYRPADILKSLSGKTIEVLNTDAEGRLILADVLTYAQRTYKPQAIVDLATLTGAMMMALGYEYCGAFVNRDDLWHEMESAAKASGEKLWRMPLDEVWKKEMEGTITDLQNMGKNGRYAGACTAAAFLEHFIEESTPWAHLDIAGTAWIKADRALTPKFGTGYGVRLLSRWLMSG